MPTSLQDRLAELRATAQETRDTRESLGLSAAQFQQLQSGTLSGASPISTSSSGSVPSPTRATTSPQFSAPSTSGVPSFQSPQSQVPQPRVGSQQQSGDTLSDIVRRQMNIQRQQAEDTTRDFSNAATFDVFETGGRTYQVNQQTGRLQDIGEASVQQGQFEQGKVIGVRSDGKRFNLGNAQAGLGFATTKEASLQSLGVAPSRGTGGSTLSSGDIGDIDFAKNLNLQIDPRRGKNESSESFTIRLMGTRLNNVSNAYNATMKAFEQQKLRDALQREQIVPLSVLRENKTLGQLKSELENDREINTQFNLAKDSYTTTRNALAQKNIEERGLRLKGSESSKRVVRAAIEKEENRKAKDEIASEHNRLGQVRKDSIDRIAEAELAQKNQSLKLASEFEGKSSLEVQKMRETKVVQEKAEQILEANPTLSLAEAQTMAKNLFLGKQKAETVIKAEKLEELTDVFTDPSFREKNIGNALSIAASSLGTLRAAKDFARNHLLLPPAEIARQELDVIRERNPHLSEEQIVGKQKKVAINDRIEQHLSGEEVDEDFLDFLDAKSPETAFRLRKKIENPDLGPAQLSALWKQESKLPRQIKKKAESQGLDVLDIVQETYPGITVDEALDGKVSGQSLGLSQSQRQKLAKTVYQQNLIKSAKTAEDISAAQELMDEVEAAESGMGEQEKMSMYKRLDSFLGGFLPGGVKRGSKIDTMTEEEFLNLSPAEQDKILSE